MNQIADILATMEYGPAPESSEHVRAWLTRHADGFGHFIGGAFVAPQDGGQFDVFNPADGSLLGRVALGGAADADAAVAAARAAFPAWSALPGEVRARHLYALARHVQKRERFLAVLETMNNGKPIRESRDIDIPLVARHFYHHAGWAALAATEFAGWRAIGVCGQIIPWNFPLMMLAWKIAPALAAGNTVVLKPASLTPLSALAFAEICAEAGLPPGVVNIVTGPGALGSTLCRHPGIDKIAFTGSTAVGRELRRITAGSGKKLSLELGGKSPFIVFEDADLDSAVEGVVDAIWFNQGQVCCAGSRLLVQEGVAPALYDKLRARMATLRVGDPLDKAIDIGAIASPGQLDTIHRYVEIGRRESAQCWQAPGTLPNTGSYFPPTLFTDVEPASTIAQEEIFGPVLAAMTFRTPDEAVALANNTRYGLAASVWSENINLCLEAAARLKAGVVWVNCTNMFDAASGFGGYRESGFGREGGREGMLEYLTPAWTPRAKLSDQHATINAAPARHPARSDATLDRTAKQFIGGKQVRPDSGYSYSVLDVDGNSVGQAGLGNRKDIRNAVEAAHKAQGWSSMSGHARAQVLYFVAENLGARSADFVGRLCRMTGAPAEAAEAEVAAALSRIIHYAAVADKFDGRVHHTKARHVTLAMPEPWGVMGISCPDDAPLLGFVSLVLPAIALGNRVVATPSPAHPLAATDFYQVLETSDVPAGVVNIVTGERDALAKVLAEHDDVAAHWYVGSASGSAAVELASAGNLKATWVNNGRAIDWFAPGEGQGEVYLHRATQIKNIWIPYGE